MVADVQMQGHVAMGRGLQTSSVVKEGKYRSIFRPAAGPLFWNTQALDWPSATAALLAPSASQSPWPMLIFSP